MSYTKSSGISRSRSRQTSTGFLANVSLAAKPAWIGLITGSVTAIATTITAIVTVPSGITPMQMGALVAGVATAGVTSFATVFLLGSASNRSLRRSVDLVQQQCWSLAEGYVPKSAAHYSNDEVGRMLRAFHRTAERMHQIRQGRSLQPLSTSPSDQQALHLLRSVLRLASGQLTPPDAVEDADQPLHRLLTAFHQLMEGRQELLTQVQSMSQPLASLLDEMDASLRSLQTRHIQDTKAINTAIGSLEALDQTLQLRLEAARELEELTTSTPGTALKAYAAVEAAIQADQNVRAFLAEITPRIGQVVETLQAVNQLVMWSNAIAEDFTHLAMRVDQELALLKPPNPDFQLLAHEIHQLALIAQTTYSDSETLQRWLQQDLNVATIAMDEVAHQAVDPSSTEQSVTVLGYLEEMIQINNRWHSFPRSMATDLADLQTTFHAVTPALHTTQESIRAIAVQTDQWLESLHQLNAQATDLYITLPHHPLSQLTSDMPDSASDNLDEDDLDEADFSSEEV